MEVEAAVFWYKWSLMRNNESTLPGPAIEGNRHRPMCHSILAFYSYSVLMTMCLTIMNCILSHDLHDCI